MTFSPDPQPSALEFKPAAARVRGFGATVFAEFTALAIQTGAVNLGQGFPNFPAPDFVKQATQQAIAADLNQYARGRDTRGWSTPSPQSTAPCWVAPSTP